MNSQQYSISLEGDLFITEIGYEKEAKQLAISNRNERIRTFLLTYGTALAGAYGAFEILKWAIPYILKYVCHCDFPWQKEA